MHGRLIRTSLGSEPCGFALVCTGPKYHLIRNHILCPGYAYMTKRIMSLANGRVVMSLEGG